MLGEVPPHSVNLQNWGVSNTWPQVLSGSAPLAFPPLMRAGNIVGSFGHGFWSHPTWARPPHLNTDAPLRHVYWLKAVCYCFSCTLLLHFTFLCKWTKRRSKRMESSQGQPCGKADNKTSWQSPGWFMQVTCKGRMKQNIPFWGFCPVLAEGDCDTFQWQWPFRAGDLETSLMCKVVSGHQEGKQSRVAGEQAPGSIPPSNRSSHTWSFWEAFFPLEKICLAYRLSPNVVTYPIHVTSRESKESPISCHEGSWLLLRIGSKGLFFHLRGFGWSKTKVGRERGSENKYRPGNRINIPVYAREEVTEYLALSWWFWVCDQVTINL